MRLFFLAASIAAIFISGWLLLFFLATYLILDFSHHYKTGKTKKEGKMK